MNLVPAEIRATRLIMIRMARFVLGALLLASVVAPLVRFVSDDAGGPTHRFSLPATVALATGSVAELTGLTSREASLYGTTLVVAVTAVRIAVLLLVVGGVATATVGVVALTSSEPRSRRLVTASAITLLAGALLLAGAALVLPVDDAGAGPAWGLWLPVAAALWVLVLHEPLTALD